MVRLRPGPSEPVSSPASKSPASQALSEHLDALVLVDHHVHGAFLDEPGDQAFRDALNEADTAPLAPGTDPLESQVGFAVRRWCAPLLDLPAHASAPDYLARRRALGQAEVDARLLGAAGVGTWLVDAGHGAGLVQTPRQLAAAGGGTAHEVVRLEAVAEELVAGGGQDWAHRFTHALRERTTDAIAWKSVIAYRAGFDVDWSVPPPAAVQEAADRWAEGVAASGRPARLEDPVLLVAGIHAALAASTGLAAPDDDGGPTRMPLQLHVGFGDRDLDLRRVDPLLLLPLLRQPRAARVPVMLLHCYPYERAAGYLAQAFANVHLDVGLAVPFLGARSPAVIARSLELAPFTKVLYSSDGWGLPELHLLGARLWRTGMVHVLAGFVDDGEWSLDDARRVATMVGSANAERAYRL